MVYFVENTITTLSIAGIVPSRFDIKRRSVSFGLGV
jgi:hypothetical protein